MAKKRLEPPSRIGKRGTGTGRDGNKFHWTVLDEIRLPDGDKKIISLEQIEFEWDEVALRLGYYMLNKKRWVWARFAPMMPVGTLQELYDEARRKGWFDKNGSA